MKVLVCGGRDFVDYRFAANALNQVHARRPITVLIHGGARGADALGARWAAQNDVEVLPFPADWDLYGKRAGPIRNRQMLRLGQPDLVIALPGGCGTMDMVGITIAAGVRLLDLRARYVGLATKRQDVA